MNQLSRRSVLGLAAAAVAAPLAANTLPAFASDPEPIPSDAWTYVSSRWATSSYWNANRPEVLVGREYGASYVWRSFFRVPLAALTGATLTTADFSILLTHTPTPDATPVHLYQVRDVDPDVPVTWNNSGDAWLRLLAAASGSSYAQQPDQLLRFDVRGAVQDAIARSASHVSFGLRAADEWNQLQWKKFQVDTATLEIRR